MMTNGERVDAQLQHLQGLLRRLSPSAISSWFRRRRFQFFRYLLETVQRPLQILDVGGTEQHWTRMRFAEQAGVRVTLLNTYPVRTIRKNFRCMVGDARDMSQFCDNQFDVAYSNSVIEHVGDFADQFRMANEVRRVARRYFVQTPNRYFPLEPHFLFPGFQFLPLALRVMLHSRFELGWMGRAPDHQTSRNNVLGIRLLTAANLRQLFPGANLYRERFLGLTKSFVAYDGWTIPTERC